MSSESTVENTQSTARDHLANERTFLAWVRTALALVGFGLVFERFIGQSRTGSTTLIALGSVTAGAATMLYATFRYHSVERALRRGEFVIARKSPLVIGWAGAVLSIALAIALWAGH